MIISLGIISKFMNKYLIASSLLLGSFTSPIFAEESKSFYLSIGGGINSISDVEADVVGTGAVSFDTNSPFQYSFAIGKEFDDWRLEFNYSSFTVASDSITVTAPGQNPAIANIVPDREGDVSSYMLFGYKDFPSDTKFSPYLGAGLGFSNLDIAAQNIAVGGANLTVPVIEEQLFTFGLKGGVEYEIADTTNLYAEVAYLNFAEFSIADGEDFDSLNSVVVSAGLRFSF